MDLSRVAPTSAPAPAPAAVPASAQLPGAPPAPAAPGAPSRAMPAVPVAAAVEAATDAGSDAIPGEHIVVFREDVGREEQASLLKSLSPIALEPLPLVNGMLVKVDPNRPPALGRLAPDDRAKILFAQPNYRQHLRGGEGVVSDVVEAGAAAAAADRTADPHQARQYHLENTGQTGGLAGADIKATAAWQKSRGAGVVIAIADTNIDIEHPDLAPNVWTNPGEVAGNGVDDDANGYVDDVHGWNFGRDSNRPQDGGQTHGTHVSGQAAAAQGNGVGGAGVAPDAKIMPLALSLNGSTTASAIKAWAYAVQNGANIISNSWGNNTYEPALAEAVKRTVAAGVSVVVAAGNENWDTGVNGSYPDNYPGSFAVAASDHGDGKASYSNRGTVTIDVAAPGDKMFSTLPGGRYGAMSGTSMAAPVVAGLLALVKAKFPELSMKQVEQRVLGSVERHGAAKVWNTLVASGGRVDADAALTPLATAAAPAPTDAPVVGTPVRLDWATDIAAGQRFEVEVSNDATARATVAETFDSGTAGRAFTTAGDKQWSIGDSVAKSGTRSFAVDGLARGQQSRLELTETIVEPTEVSFAYRGGGSGELSFFVNRDLQFQPTRGEDWQEFRTTLQPGTYTFTWLATSRGGTSKPVAIDDLRIGSVSDATWTPVGATDPGSTGIFWTPGEATTAAAARVRADNGRFRGEWVTSEPFEVFEKKGGSTPAPPAGTAATVS